MAEEERQKLAAAYAKQISKSFEVKNNE